MAKATSQFVCQTCAARYTRWMGKCEQCGAWNSLAEEAVSAGPRALGKARQAAGFTPTALKEVQTAALPRIASGIGEFDQVLGGGIVQGSVMLLSGDPGIGKSTLVLQIAAHLAQKESVLYVSGEESATQIIPAFCSVVVARGATTGRMVLVGSPMAMNQTCYALMTTTETPFALYCRLREEIDGLVHGAHGSVFDTITTSTFASSRIVQPPRSSLKAFEDTVAPGLQRVLGNLFESRTLATLRDTLLPKLISGELRVRDVERFAERGRPTN